MLVEYLVNVHYCFVLNWYVFTILAMPPVCSTIHSFCILNSIAVSKLKKKYSVALVRERTIPTELPPPVGEVSANFCG